MNFKSLPISLKLALSNLIYIAPISVMILIILSVYQTNIDFAVKEKSGNNYQSKVLILIENLSHLYESQTTGAQNQNAIEKVKNSLTEFVEISKNESSNLKLSLESLKKRGREHLYFTVLEEKINSIVQSDLQKNTKDTDLYNLYNTTIMDLRSLITHIGDVSNLILDPDLDSFYLMDMTLVALPQTQQRIFEIWNFLNQSLKSNALTMQDRKWYTIKTDNLKTADLDRLKADFESVLKEDENFNGKMLSLNTKLEPSVKVYFDKIDSLIERLNQIEVNNFNQELIKKLIPEVQSAYYNSFELNHSGLIELNHLLDRRVDNQIQSKNQNLIYSSVAVIIAALLSTMIGLSIKSEIVTKVSSVVSKLNQIVDKINQSNSNLVKTSVSLANDTTEQASAIEETVASTEEMTAMLKQTSSFSKQSLDIAQKTIEESEETKKMTSQLERAMKEINSSAQQLERIENIIHQIQMKTKIINDIVFETRLLSFNASIEAARAGIHGKGFAVVSEEIGKLASLSGNSATEINSLLEKSILEVKSVINNINDSVTKGVDSFRVTDQNFNQIFSTLNSISDIIQSINRATHEQETGIKQTNVAMHNMDKVTKSNSINSELLSKEAVTINSQMAALNEAMNDLKKVISIKNQDIQSA